MSDRHWFEIALLPNGWAERVGVEVSAGQIVDLTVGEEAPSTACHRHWLAVPGLCNLHSHAFQRAMAGLAEHRGPDNDSFWTWRELMYRFAGRIGPDEMEAIAALAYAEMLESGFVRVGEFHYLHRDRQGQSYADPAEMGTRLASAARETGIALTLLPVFYAHSGFGGAEPGDDQARFVNDVDSYARLLDASRAALAGLDGSVVGVAPHSLRAVTPDELSQVARMAAGGPVHIHIAEQVAEVEACQQWSRARPIEWLLANAPVDESWCLVHSTHATATELAGIARSGAVAGLCPITEANLGDGIFPARTYADFGGRWGIGSDSNILIDAAQELAALEYSQRLQHRLRNVLADHEGSTGAALFSAARAGGAQALGVSNDGIAAGARADFVTLDRNHPSLMARTGDLLLDGWLFGAARGAISEVWCAGRQVVAQGQHVAREEIVTRYRTAVNRLVSD